MFSLKSSSSQTSLRNCADTDSFHCSVKRVVNCRGRPVESGGLILLIFFLWFHFSTIEGASGCLLVNSMRSALFWDVTGRLFTVLPTFVVRFGAFRSRTRPQNVIKWISAYWKPHVNQIFNLMGRYAVYIGSLLPTFRDIRSVPS